MQHPIGRIPKFVTARNPKRLRAVMLRTQARLGYGVGFFDIHHVNGLWYAWYHDNDDVRQDTVEKELNANISNRESEG